MTYHDFMTNHLLIEAIQTAVLCVVVIYMIKESNHE